MMRFLLGEFLKDTETNQCLFFSLIRLGILNFLSGLSVITNAFMLAKASSWSQTFQNDTNLNAIWIVVFFEHIIFSIRVSTFLVFSMPHLAIESWVNFNFFSIC
eukprot:Sdes_comp25825_c0_seq1m22860